MNKSTLISAFALAGVADFILPSEAKMALWFGLVAVFAFWTKVRGVW